VDFDGKTNQFVYGNASFPTAVTQITNTAYNLVVKFNYDTNGFLTNIVDVMGISSSFQYALTNDVYFTALDTNGLPAYPVTNSVNLLTKLRTPYGDTSFDYLHPTWPLTTDQTPYSIIYTYYGSVNRALTVTQPDGGKHLFLYSDYSRFFTIDNYPVPCGGVGGDCAQNFTIFDNSVLPIGSGELIHDNSYYWGPRQYAALTTTVLTNLQSSDFISARLRNWLHSDPYTSIYSVSQTLNAEQTFSPDNTYG